MAKAKHEWVKLTVALDAPDERRVLERITDATITRKAAIDLLRTIADDLEAGPVRKYAPGRAKGSQS